MDIKEKVARMTDEELCSALRGKGNWDTFPLEREGLKSFSMADGPNGLRVVEDATLSSPGIPATLLPSETCLASTFNVELAKEYGRCIGKECRMLGKDMILGPGINIKRNPLCGRSFEYMSEDPFLTCSIAKSYIDGVHEEGSLVCIKHYACNSQETRRMSVDEIVDDRALEEIYLYSFRKLVEEGKADAVMASYNKVNNIHATENRLLLTDKLRDEYGFEGIVVSDWFAINDPCASIEAGLDLEMPQGNDKNYDAVINRIKEDKKFKEECQRAVARTYSLAEKTTKKNREDIDIDQGYNTAKKIASEGIILLKNNMNILPLKNEDDILIAGEVAMNPFLQGGGSSRVNAAITKSFLSIDNSKHEFTRGYNIDNPDDLSFLEEALDAMRRHQTVLLFVGMPSMEGEDRKDIFLPLNQRRLIEKAVELGKRIILVIETAFVIDIPFLDKVDAVLLTNYSGEAGEEALSDILYGKTNPSGHLAESYPLSIEDVPGYEDYATGNNISLHRESIFVGYRNYTTIRKKVLFPFGHGLSYSTFEIHDFNVSVSKEKKSVSFKIKNTSSIPGKAVPQVYVEKPSDIVFNPLKELCVFSKIALEPGEERTISLELPSEATEFYDFRKRRWILLPGRYRFHVGFSCEDICLSTEVTVEGANIFSPYDGLDVSSYKNGYTRRISDEEFLQFFATKPSIKENDSSISWDSSLKECIDKGSKGARRFFSIASSFKPLKGDKYLIENFLNSPLRVICYNDKSLSRNSALLMKVVTKKHYFLSLVSLLLHLLVSQR